MSGFTKDKDVKTEFESDGNILSERKKKFFSSLNLNGKNIYYLLLLPILWLTWFVRTRNLPNLQGKYLLGLDPYFFYRYAQIIIEKGSLPVIDYLRYSPLGFPTARFSFFSHTLAYFYKVFSVFSPSMSQIEWHIIYPPVITIISFVFFFLFVREFFDSKIAILSTAFLAVIPAYIYRTGAGFADHEAMALFWMFLSLYFLALMWKSNNWKKSTLFGSFSGLLAVAMAATWDGVIFLTIPFGIFALLMILFDKIKKPQIIGYFSWSVVYFLISLIYGIFFIENVGFTFKTTSLILIFPIIIYAIYSIIKKVGYKGILLKIKKYMPFSFLAFFITTIICVVPVLIFNFVDLFKIQAKFLDIAPVIGRFRTTVSESQGSFILGGNGWWSSFNWILFFGMLGLIFMVYVLFKIDSEKTFSSKQLKFSFPIVGSFILFILFFILGRLSPAAKYNTIVSFFGGYYILIILSITAFIFFMCWNLYHKDKDSFSNLLKNKSYFIFIIIWTVLGMVLARSSTRMLIMLAPPLAIASGYFIISLTKKLLKHDKLKLFGVILIIIAIAVFLYNANNSYNMNKSSGSGYPGQWESSMTWIRENTGEDAVIAHWWDYGYWTQTEGNKTSIGDGGNNRGWNHGLGRYIMTSTEIDKTLEYSKTHKATHILYSKEEIPKYHAFSLIGSDENLDRYSTIGIFNIQSQKEMRNGTKIIYSGTWPTDKDYVIGNLVIPQGQAAIIGFTYIFNGIDITDPKIHLYYNGQQREFGLDCIYTQGKKLEFKTNDSIGGCITLIPQQLSKDAVNPIGGALWTSEKVKDGLFAKLYIFNENIPYFKEVYNDKVPLAIYNNHLIGPIKIWEINYPGDIKTDDKYLESSAYG